MRRKREIVERITVTGDMVERGECLKEYYDNGYDVRYCNPKRLSATKLDTSKFKMIAEKVIA